MQNKLIYYIFGAAVLLFIVLVIRAFWLDFHLSYFRAKIKQGRRVRFELTGERVIAGTVSKVYPGCVWVNFVHPDTGHETQMPILISQIYPA